MPKAHMLDGFQVADILLFASEELFGVGLAEIAQYAAKITAAVAQKKKRDELIVLAACGDLKNLQQKLSEADVTVKSLLAEWVSEQVRFFRKRSRSDNTQYHFPEPSCAAWDILASLLFSESHLNPQVARRMVALEKSGVKPPPAWYDPNKYPD